MGMGMKLLSAGQLADTADHALYTAPGNASASITAAIACNAGATTTTLTVAVVPRGGTADGTNTIRKATSFTAGTTIALTELVGLCLGPGDSIHATASVAAMIDVVLSGIEND